MQHTKCSNWHAILLLALLVSPLEAGKMGKGKPGGGEDPPPPELPPVRYEITPVAVPGTGYYFNDSNEAHAIVGWYTGGDAGTGIRAMAYLPWISTTHAVDLNGPEAGVVGIPAGWHLRSAIGLNNHGDVVGNIAPNDLNDARRQPIFLDMNATPPQLTVLGPFDANSSVEFGCSINDSGDIAVCSDGGRQVYVGNPGLYGNNSVPFTRIDFEILTGVTRQLGDYPRLTNRFGMLPAMLVGTLQTSTFDEPFRMALDFSWFELAETYQDDAGSLVEMRYVRDVNDIGDVAGTTKVSLPKKGKSLNGNNYASVWQLGSTEFHAVASNSGLNSPWYSAVINNHGDSIVNNASGSVYSLWHNAWSAAANGACDIRSLIDPEDPHRNLYTVAHELSDRVPIAEPNSANELDFWPVIIAKGTEVVDGAERRQILILDPVAYP